jgi:NAD(P)-dependent dehydrogenase (short-subunit alcohol dehydrogenase family)
VDEIRFDGRVVLVTGAGRGLGRDHAVLMASRGAAVVVNDLGGDVHGDGAGSGPADDVVAEIEAAGGDAVASYDSVATSEGAAAIVGVAVERFGRLDAVVNNAGIQIVKPFTQMTVQDLEQHLAVHLAGTFQVTKAAWPHLAASGAGRVVNTTSTASLGITGYTSYSSAKAALIGFTRSLALEGTAHGIHVNAVAPSAATRMAFAEDAGKDIPADVRERMAATSPARLVSPVVAFLAHPSCDLNGEILFAGAGRVSRIVFAETAGYSTGELDVEDVAANIPTIVDDRALVTLPDAMQRTQALAQRTATR